MELSQVSFVVGILVTNLALIIGAYISLRVSVAILAEKVGRLEADVNNLGSMYRNNKQRKEA